MRGPVAEPGPFGRYKFGGDSVTWDVFVSYASEDKSFARRLAHGLESAGLRVWFDETALEAGDSLRRAIDKGLKDSQYGVVVLSTNFLRKSGRNAN